MSSQIRSQMQQETEHYINVSIYNLYNLMHEMPNLNLIMFQYIFTTMTIPVNLFTRRLYNNMRYGIGEYFLEDMRVLMERLSRNQVIMMNDFIGYISRNRSNPNLHYMITAYNN